MGLLFVTYPFLEIYLIFKLTDIYSFGDVLMFMLTTAVLGAALVSMLGKALLVEAQRSFALGKVPPQKILHRVFMLIGGILIFLPGIVSDLMGVLLILPGTRHLIVFWSQRFLAKSIGKGQTRFFWMGKNGFPKAPQPERDARVIDVDVIESSRRSTES